MAISNLERKQALARAYVNLKAFPTGWRPLEILAAEAKAYHTLNPYPWWHFQEWKKEIRGPYPRCMPFVRTMVQKPARWLFGTEPEITIKQDLDLQNWVRQQWTANNMPSEMVSAAEKAGYQGGICLKFSYDEELSPPLRIQVLSSIDECKLYFDPLDRKTLIMARIQFPYQDLEKQGKWFFYREEWTDEEEIHYEPLECNIRTSAFEGLSFPRIAYTIQDGSTPDEYDDWKILTRDPNPFGVIPIHYVKNKEIGDVWGAGHLWGLFRAIDRVNLNFHLQERSDQRDEPSLIFMDVDIDRQDSERPLAPQEPLSLKSDETDDGQKKQGKVDLIEAKGDLREHMAKEAKERMRQILDAASVTIVDSSEFTNKGNLTGAVLMQLYAPMLELMNEMKKTYGEDGICKFLEKALVGLKNLADGNAITSLKKLLKKVDPKSYDTHDVTLRFGAPFFLPEDERNLGVMRIQMEEKSGYTTHARAIEMVAGLEGVRDVQVLQNELAAVTAAADDQQVEWIKTPPDPQQGGAKGMQDTARQAKGVASV